MTVRRSRPGDGEAIARIHRDMTAYYTDLAPHHFQMPMLDGFAHEVDAELGNPDDRVLHLVAELNGEVVGALVARLLTPDEGAERQIAPDLGETRLRIDYLATDEAHRRHGVGTRLVQAAEAWGRDGGATVVETWTYHRSPLSVPFWEQRMGYEKRSVNLRKRL
jgi:GNAT superfamily N-acetyltransferase